MRFIRSVRVESPGTRNEHITHIRYSETPYGAQTTLSRDSVVLSIRSGWVYRSHRDLNGAEAPVVVKVGARGQHYIATVADSTETNNLLELPRF